MKKIISFMRTILNNSENDYAKLIPARIEALQDIAFDSMI